jgi:hypothetical protein
MAKLILPFARYFTSLRRFLNDNPVYEELLLGWLRILILLSLFMMAVWFGGWQVSEKPMDIITQDLMRDYPILSALPPVFAKDVAIIVCAFSPLFAGNFPVFDWGNLRFIFLPLAVMVAVTIGAGMYVQDIYNIRKLWPAVRYVMSSMFAAFYPTLVVDGGKKVLEEDEINTIDAIGGPGHVVIQPGNAVLFRRLRGESRYSVNRSFFVAPFEVISQIVNLDDQIETIPEKLTVTRDGIQVKIRDIQYRYRVLADVSGNVPGARTPQNPYPFARDSLTRIASNLAVNDFGQIPWRMGVQNAVLGAVTDYVNARTIDFLTAPRQDNQDPRRDIRQTAMRSTVFPLRNIGAELLWIDVGHFDIVEEDVDQSRVSLWAAEWAGNAEVARAYGDAKRMAYQELGRAEGQAEMIMAVAQALQEANMSGNPDRNVRNLILMRTAQMLDAMNDNRREEQ